MSGLVWQQRAAIAGKYGSRLGLTVRFISTRGRVPTRGEVRTSGEVPTRDEVRTSGGAGAGARKSYSACCSAFGVALFLVAVTGGASFAGQAAPLPQDPAEAPPAAPIPVDEPIESPLERAGWAPAPIAVEPAVGMPASTTPSAAALTASPDSASLTEELFRRAIPLRFPASSETLTAAADNLADWTLAADAEVSIDSIQQRLAEVTRVQRVAFRIRPPSTGVYEVIWEGASAETDGAKLLVMDDERRQLTPLSGEVALAAVTGGRWLLAAERTYFCVVEVAEPHRFALRVKRLEEPDPRVNAEHLRLDADQRCQHSRGFSEEHPVHHFAVTVPFTGELQVQVEALEPELDPFIRFFDRDFNTLNLNDDASAETVNAALRCRVIAGETYYIEAAPFGATWGNFKITVQGEPARDPFRSAQLLTWEQDQIERREQFEVANAQRYFSFEAKSDGAVTAVAYAEGNPLLDTMLAIFDASGKQIALNDDAFAENTDAAVTFLAHKGQRYLLRASGYGTETGSFRLLIVPGGIPSPFDRAQPVTFNEWGYGTSRGRVDAGQTPAYFHFAAPAYGDIEIDVARGMASQLVPLLRLYNESRTLLVERTASRQQQLPTASLRFRAEPGENFFVEVGPAADLGGDFAVALTHTARPQPLDQAQRVELPDDGETTQRQELACPFDAQAFRFVATHTGPFSVECLGDPADRLEPQVTVLGEDHQVLAEAQSTTLEGVMSPYETGVTWHTESGTPYLVVVRGQAASCGEYHLRFRPGTLISPFDMAQPLNLNEQGSGQWEGMADGTGNMELLRLDLPAAGKYAVVVEAAEPMTLDTRLTIFDEDRQLMGHSDDGIPHSTDAAFAWEAVESGTCYLHVGAYAGSPGKFRVAVAPGEIPSPLDAALEVALGGELTWRCTATLANTGELDYYKLISPIDGKLTVTQRAAPATSVDPLLLIVDSHCRELDGNDDAFADSLDAQVAVAVEQGQPVFIAATAADENAGPYELELALNEVADPFATPNTLQLKEGKVVVEGELTREMEARVYELTTEAATQLLVRLEAIGDNNLDTVLSLFNEDRQSLATNDDANDFEVNSELTYEMAAGQTILIHATDYRQMPGKFRLQVETIVQAVAER